MSKNKKSKCFNVLSAMTVTTMLIGLTATSVIAAPGDYYDRTDSVHYNVSGLTAETRAQLEQAYANEHSFAKELSGGKYLDYNAARTKIEQGIVAGTPIGDLLTEVSTDPSMFPTINPSDYTEPGETAELKVVSVSAINLRTLKVTFSNAVDEATAINNANYLLDGTNLDGNTVIELSADGKTAIINLEAADVLTNKSYVTVTVSDSNNITDPAGSALTEVAKLVYVNDTTLPTATKQDYVKANDELTIDFSERLATLGTVTIKDATGVPQTVAYSIPFASGDNKVVFDTSGLTVDKSYTVTLVGAKDLAGNYFANNKYEYTFTTGTTDTTAPTITSVVAKSATLIEVTFSEKLSAPGTLNSSAIVPVASEALRNADYKATVDASGLVYTIQVPAMANDTFTPYVFAAQADLAGVPIVSVTKNVGYIADTTDPTIVSQSVAGKILTIVFDESVLDAGGAGSVITPSGVLLPVADAQISVSGTNPKAIKVDLGTAVTTVESGNYKVTLPDGVITDADGNSKEYVVNTTLGNTDTTKPVVNSATYTAGANAGTVDVNFSEDMSSSAIDVNNYTVDGAKVFKSAVFNGNKQNVKLTLKEGVFDVTSDRTFVASNLKDLAGNVADTYTDVALNLTDNTAPALVSAKLESDLTTITLTFNENVDDTSIAASDFDVLVGDVKESGFSIVSGTADDNVTTITLADALTPTEFAKTITIKATDTFALTDTVGNVNDDFTSKVVAK